MAEPPSVLVVDDEPENLALLARALRSCHANVVTASDGAAALGLLRTRPFAAIVTDYVMAGLTGVELLERASRLSPSTVRIMVSGFADADVLRAAINRGHVSHYLPKPVDLDELRRLVDRATVVPTGSGPTLVLGAGAGTQRVIEALHAAELSVAIESNLANPHDDTDVLVWNTPLSATSYDGIRRVLVHTQRARERQSSYGLREMIGHTPVMQRVFDQIERVAGTVATVLVRGETGTGKEMVARMIHALSPRRDRPFVAINCAALPESLVESELFGHERGAFTGAQTRRLGRFERADGGTLFIDEVGNIPAAVQVKLLRVLQERCIERVGGTQTLSVDIRLIAATNRDLEAAIERGLFREDLFYRLNVVPVELPPLRDRRADIPVLAEHLLTEFMGRLSKDDVRLAPAMIERMQAYDWPGNVRELMNVIERAVALTPSGGVADLQQLRTRVPRQRLIAAVPEKPHTTLKQLVADYERTVIAQALERHNNNRTRAAKDLGISRQGLSLKIAKYEL